MKQSIKVLSVILSVNILILCFISTVFASNQTNASDIGTNGIISERLSDILKTAGDKEAIDIVIMLKFRAELNSAEAYKEFFSAKNKEFADKLPAGVKVTYISAYSPLINATAAKEDIYKIAEMEDVSSISEGEKYIATDVNSTNKNTSDEIVYFNSTLTVNGVKTSFIENEYYKVYADFYGKYFYDNFKKNPPQNKIDKNLYSNIKQPTNECYITVILKGSSKKAEDIAQALNIEKDAVIAACKSYPAAMIKILPNSINALIANINVDAIYMHSLPQRHSLWLLTLLWRKPMHRNPRMPEKY